MRSVRQPLYPAEHADHLQMPVYPGLLIEEASVHNPRMAPTSMGLRAAPKILACRGSRPTPNEVKSSACANTYSSEKRTRREPGWVDSTAWNYILVADQPVTILMTLQRLRLTSGK